MNIFPLLEFLYDMSQFDGVAESWDDEDGEKKEIFLSSKDSVDEW